MSRLEDFLELEAEEGSDNENHDENVRIVKEHQLQEDNSENDDPNQDLEDLINNDDVTSSSLKNDHIILRNKFLQDELDLDRTHIKKVINMEFKKKRKYNEIEDSDEDYQNFSDNPNSHRIINNDHLSKRKKMVSSLLGLNSHPETTQESDFNKKKIINISKCKKIFQSDNLELEEESQKELIDELLHTYEIDVKKKIGEKSSKFKKRFNDRLKENNKIMENVINLNKSKVGDNNKNINKNPFLPHLSHSSTNSVLNAMKTDKYYSQKEVNKNNLKSEFNLEKMQQQNNNFSVFNNLKNNKLDSEKKMKISAIFEKSDRTEVIKIKNKN